MNSCTRHARSLTQDYGLAWMGPCADVCVLVAMSTPTTLTKIQMSAVASSQAMLQSSFISESAWNHLCWPKPNKDSVG
jgi:hypothetical protein